ncbi:conserved hypothetical protein [Histoplasma capsulatum H143]|uniref:Uncharacterized protein n=1 Tax=Ajellomyces capsulatus (strain H143) TaxID=544712 RepID=C6H317_AJECH|nr:conserved hypothetical protein [Histoplasma capsulatum H143]
MTTTAQPFDVAIVGQDGDIARDIGTETERSHPPTMNQRRAIACLHVPSLPGRATSARDPSKRKPEWDGTTNEEEDVGNDDGAAMVAAINIGSKENESQSECRKCRVNEGGWQKHQDHHSMENFAPSVYFNGTAETNHQPQSHHDDESTIAGDQEAGISLSESISPEMIHPSQMA